MALQILTAACLLIPLLGAGIAAQSGRNSRSIARGSLLAGIITLLMIALCLDESGRVTLISEWLISLKVEDGHLTSHGIGLEFAFSGTLIAMTIGLQAALWVLTLPGLSPPASCDGHHESDSSRPVCVCLLQLLTFVAISASNLAVILATWLAIDAVVSVLHRGRNASEERSPFMPLRLVSVVLGLGILWLGIRYHTADLEGLLTSVLQDRQLDAAQVRSGMAIVIAAALAWRSGLFPSILWIQRLIASPAPDSLSVAWISAVSIVVPAVALLWRMQSLWALCPDAAFLISAFGALTCLICGVSACVRSVDESVDATLGSTTLWCLLIGIGQTCIALAAGRSDQVGPSAYFATFGVPLLAVVASCAWQPTRFKFLVGSAVAVLTSGMLGQEAALQFAQTVVGAQSGDAARSVLGFNLAKSALAVWMTGLIGQMLMGFALVKSICRDSEARDSTHPVTDSQNRLDWGRVIISGAVIAIWVLFGLMARSSDSTAKPGAVTWLDLHQHLFSPSAAEGATRLLTMGVTLPAGWLGCLVAWVLWSLKPKLGMQLARLLEPLLRVPRNGWYLEAIVRWVIVRPVRFASSVVETFDRRLLGGGREGAWSQPASSTAEFFDTSRHAAGRYSLMAMCGAAVALLIVLMLR